MAGAITVTTILEYVGLDLFISLSFPCLRRIIDADQRADGAKHGPEKKRRRDSTDHLCHDVARHPAPFVRRIQEVGRKLLLNHPLLRRDAIPVCAN